MTWTQPKCDKLQCIRKLCNDLAQLEIKRTLDQAKHVQQAAVISRGMGTTKRSG